MANPFVTPPNQLSFSSLIDEVILATGKPGSLISAVQQANLTIRECQGLGLFAQDLVEETPLSVAATPVTWTRPQYFRKMRTVKYAGVDPASGLFINVRWPKFYLPGKIQKDVCDYFYAASNYFVFNGPYIGDQVCMANYYWATPLEYYALAGGNTSQFPGGPYNTRLAYYDLMTAQWMYLLPNGTYANTTGNPTTDAQYQAVSTNWLVDQWRSLIISGTKAKIWGSVGDARGPVEFSLYKTLQRELQMTSGYEAEGY